MTNAQSPRHFVALLSLLFLASAVAFGQASISGTVKDAAGTALAAADGFAGI